MDMSHPFPAQARLFYAGLAYARDLRFFPFYALAFHYDGPGAIVVDPAALAAFVAAALRTPPPRRPSRRS